MKGEMKVVDLIGEIEKHQLILPEFQRGYVWSQRDVREYMRSLYRGYPTGSFLIWKTPQPGQIRGGDKSNDDGKHFQLILDGQQRLTSVFTVMRGEPPPFYEGEKLFFNLYFNLLDETFAYYKPIAMKGNVEWIPVTDFFQQGVAAFFAERKDESEIYLANFEKLQRLDAVRNYSYYVDTISEEEIDQVVEIFNLVNSSGTRLSKSDLALAHICASWPEARQIFREAQAQLASAHFDFGLDLYMRLASTVATGSALYEPLYNAPIEDVQKGWKKAHQALEYLVNILRSDAFVDSSRHLKSAYPLVPLVVHLARNAGTFSGQREQRDFLHWMYAALMWGRYSGSTESKLNLDVAALSDAHPIAQLRDNIVKERGRIQLQASDLDRAGVTSTFYPMTYIVARARGAVDWFNGQPLYAKNVGAMFGLEAHHIFPTSVLYKESYSSSDTAHRQIVNQIANLAFLTKKANIKSSNTEPLAYLVEVRDAYPGALEAQFIPTDESLWALERFEDFVAARRELIAEGINAFMDALIADDPQAETTLEALIAQGESTRVEYKGSLRYDHATQQPNKELVKSVTKTLAAFLNAQGGTLLIGVMDDGTVAGIEHDYSLMGDKGTRDGFELALRNAIRSQLGAEINPLIESTFGEVNERTVAIVSCEPYHRPVFLQDGSQAEFYVRAGNSSQPLDVRAASEYIEARWAGSSTAESVA